MAKWSINQIQGILLLIAAILLFVNIPFVDEKTIAAIAIVIIGIYNLFRKR